MDRIMRLGVRRGRRGGKTNSETMWRCWWDKERSRTSWEDAKRGRGKTNKEKRKVAWQGPGGGKTQRGGSRRSVWRGVGSWGWKKLKRRGRLVWEALRGRERRKREGRSCFIYCKKKKNTRRLRRRKKETKEGKNSNIRSLWKRQDQERRKTSWKR